MAITLAFSSLGGEPAKALGVTSNLSNFTVSTETFQLPTHSVSFQYGIYNTKEWIQSTYGVYATCAYNIYINNTHYYNLDESVSVSNKKLASSKGWATNTQSFSFPTSTSKKISTSAIFNTNNKTSKTATLNIKTDWRQVGATDIGDSVSQALVTFSGNAIITLNVPPTFNEGYPTISKNTDNYYKNVTTITVNSNATAYYGGDISSTTLTIGNQTQTIEGNGSIAIKLNTTGTFTPTLTVIDSRGQTVTHTFNSITVIEGEDTTFESTQVSSNKDGFWTEQSKASVTISNIVVPYSGSVTQTSFTIGSQTVTGTNESTLKITPNTVGTFTPIVSVTDSFGRVYLKNLNPITINLYQRPNITSIDVYRVEHNSDFGKMDDEGTWAVAQIPITYINQVSNLLQPTIEINGIDISTLGVSVKWYSSWNQISGLTNQISWTNYNPTSPTTVYALLRREFNFDTAYTISAIAKDGVGQQSDERTTTLTAAFFTVDFLAGGHGIAFGAPAKNEGFLSNMDTTFGKEIYAVLDSDQAEGTDHDLIQGITQLGWTDALR